MSTARPDPALSLRDRLDTAAVRALLSLPLPAVSLLAGAAIVKEGRTLDPHMQLVLRLLRLTGKRNVENVSLERARQGLRVASGQLAPPRPRLAAVDDNTLGGVPVRVYRPTPRQAQQAAVIFCHGGGFALGDLDSHDIPCRLLALRTGAVVISVGYRLAPEHPFPAAYDDAIAVARAVFHHCAALGVDPARVAVAGDSAGGNLAAGIALALRGDRLRPCHQLLIYPVTDMTMSQRSITTLGTGFFLEKTTIAWYRDKYLQGHDDKDPRAAPLFADVAGVCPATVVTAGFDPLRDEGDAYAARLKKAGVVVTHQAALALFHGFWNTTGYVPTARAAVEQATATLATALARS